MCRRGPAGALGLRRTADASSLRRPGTQQSLYNRLLGVRPRLPGHGHTTVHLGSRMPVMRAMAEASEEFVEMHQLSDTAGRRVAEVTGAEQHVAVDVAMERFQRDA